MIDENAVREILHRRANAVPTIGVDAPRALRRARRRLRANGAIALLAAAAIAVATFAGAGAIQSDRVPADRQTPSPAPGVLRAIDVVASARMTWKGTATFDLDRGTEQPRNNEGCDLDYMPVDATRGIFTNVNVYSCGGSAPIFLGRVDPWVSLTPVRLASLDYSNPITGEGRDLARELHPGDIYAIFTNSGNYTKLEILKFGRTVKIRYVTYGITRSLPSLSPSG